METLKIFIILVIIMSYCDTIYSQETSIRQEIGIQVGLSFSSINEERFSTITKQYTQPKFGLRYSKWNDNRRVELIISYTTTKSTTNPQALWYKLINPEVSYAYQKKFNDTWVGGFFNSSSILLFPKNGRKLFGNNPISYTIGHSLGLAVDRSLNIVKSGMHEIVLDAGARTSLISHIIRPAYAHPYPDHYLQAGIFSPTRSGMGRSIIKSGKVRSINKYYNMRLVLRINYVYDEKLKIGMEYARNIQKVKEGKWLSYHSHDLLLGISYLY